MRTAFDVLREFEELNRIIEKQQGIIERLGSKLLEYITVEEMEEIKTNDVERQKGEKTNGGNKIYHSESHDEGCNVR